MYVMLGKIAVLLTSLHITLNSFHRMRGRMFFRNARFTSASTISSSASRGCRGKDAGFVLQALMAQVRKLRVRSFMFCVVRIRSIVGVRRAGVCDKFFLGECIPVERVV